MRAKKIQLFLQEMNTALEFLVFSNKALFLLYLLICGNFLGSLFACQVQRILQTNVFAKHIICIATLTFFVILADSQAELRPFYQQITAIIFFYIWFMLSTKTDAPIMITIWLLFFMGYLLTIYIDKRDKNGQPLDIEQHKRSIKIRSTLSISAAILTIIGMLVYMGEKKTEYGNKFNYSSFFFGQPRCRKFTPSRAKATFHNWPKFFFKAFS
ncbi:MAG: hypothetical protein RJA52_1180 [Bacteroidota bacterium]